MWNSRFFIALRLITSKSGLGYVRDRANEIRAIVPNAPLFPDNLGIIALPYSQATTFFLNPHWLMRWDISYFKKRGISAQFRLPGITAIGQVSGTGLPLQELSWCLDCILRWSEELYCDLFALWLIGPAFSFSFIELFALTAVGT